jgi:RNA polymerase sigma factor (TIGR02999 family)
MRLVGDGDAHFENRAHFFSAAAEAMRRILVDSVRRKKAVKRDGGRISEELKDEYLVQDMVPDELLALDEALDLLAREDPTAAELVKLRYFAGMNHDEAAAMMGISVRSAQRSLTYARSWLRRQMEMLHSKSQ